MNGEVSNPTLFSSRCLNNNEMIKRRMEAKRSPRGPQVYKDKAEKTDSSSRLQMVHNSN